MKEVKGDLLKKALQGEFDVIIHGCNCFVTMGAGIALQIKKLFPKAAEVDSETIPGDVNKLGHFTFADLDEGFTVVNAYTQYGHNPKRVNVNYEAVREAFCRIKNRWGGQGKKFGIPMIGAGLAGGKWEILSKVIEEEMVDEDLTLVIFDPED